MSSSPAPVPPTPPHLHPVPYTVYQLAPGPLGHVPLAYVQRPGYVVYPTVAAMAPWVMPPPVPYYRGGWWPHARSRSHTWSRSDADVRIRV